MKLDFNLIILILSLVQNAYEVGSFSVPREKHKFIMKATNLPQDLLDNYRQQMVEIRNIYGKCFVDGFEVIVEHLENHSSSYFEADISWRPLVNACDTKWSS